MIGTALPQLCTSERTLGSNDSWMIQCSERLHGNETSTFTFTITLTSGRVTVLNTGPTPTAPVWSAEVPSAAQSQIWVPKTVGCVCCYCVKWMPRNWSNLYHEISIDDNRWFVSLLQATRTFFWCRSLRGQLKTDHRVIHTYLNMPVR